MEITKAGMAGTLESSDAQVTVEPGEGKIDNMLKMLTDQGYQKEQHDGFSAYIAPWKQ